jgi:hypothetical protein
MSMLEHCGCLRAFRTFDHSESLLDRLDRLPRTVYLANYSELLAHPIDRPLRTAIERLLSRSPSPAQKRPAAQGADPRRRHSARANRHTPRPSIDAVVK